MGKAIANVIAKIIRVAIYIRVSHEEQARHGLSLEAQKETLKKYAKEKGWKVVDVYADEGITARKKLSKRKEFQRLMTDVKSGKIDMIIFIKLDRWFRNVPDYYKTQEILEKNNVNWEATEEEYDTTTANGRLHLNIKLSIAQNESDQTSDRINFVFANRKKNGFVVSGSKKMGYKIVDKKYVIDEEESKTIIECFEYCKKSGSIGDTLYFYNESHTPICYDTMRKWLTDSAYIGDYIDSRGNLLKNFTPRIMTDELFYEVQNLIRRKIRTEKGKKELAPMLFDGLLYCKQCGSKYARQLHGQRPDSTYKYRYYFCWKSRKPQRVERMHQCTNTVTISEPKIEEYLLKNFKQLAENYIVNNTIIEKKPVKKKKNNSELLKKKIANLQTLFIENLIEIDEYKKRYEVLNEELQKNEIQNEKIEKPKDFSKIKKMLNENIQTLYDSLDYREKKEFWLSVIDKIYVEHGEIVNVAFL